MVETKDFYLNDKYTISIDGRVYSKYSSKYLKIEEAKGIGYKRVSLVLGGGKKRSFLLHRLLAIHFIPNPEGYEYINHKDGNKLNNTLDNLEWCTSGYNQEHAYASGLKSLPKGEVNGRSILKEDDVLNIYSRLLKGDDMNALAKEYQVNYATIFNIKVKRSWGWLLAGLEDCITKGKANTLTEETVREICEHFVNKTPPSKIYNMYSNKVNKNQIYDLKRRRGFKHITCDYEW